MSAQSISICTHHQHSTQHALTSLAHHAAHPHSLVQSQGTPRVTNNLKVQGFCPTQCLSKLCFADLYILLAVIDTGASSLCSAEASILAVIRSHVVTGSRLNAVGHLCRTGGDLAVVLAAFLNI